MSNSNLNANQPKVSITNFLCRKSVAWRFVYHWISFYHFVSLYWMIIFVMTFIITPYGWLITWWTQGRWPGMLQIGQSTCAAWSRFVFNLWFVFYRAKLRRPSDCLVQELVKLKTKILSQDSWPWAGVESRL